MWDVKKREYAVLWLDNTAVFTFAADEIGHAKPSADRIPMLYTNPPVAAFTRHSVTTGRPTDGRGQSTILTRPARHRRSQR